MLDAPLIPRLWRGITLGMNTAKILRITEHRGNPRLWLQGKAPERSGFMPGARYSVVPTANGVIIKVSDDGDRTVSRKVYRSGGVAPVLDVNSGMDLGPLVGCEVVRVVFSDGCVHISPMASEVRRVRRLERLKAKLQRGEPLETAGIAAGAGILTSAIHQGLKDAGLKAHAAIHNEIRDDLCDHALDVNEALSPDTTILNVPLQELAFDETILRQVGEVDIVELGLPCSGASVAGRAKRGLSHPEAHPDVGHLVAAGLALLIRLNPAVAIFENVPSYRNTASASIIRQQLRDMGYETQEVELLATDFGDLEARRRWCLVAVTRGIEFDLSALPVPGPSERTIADVLEPSEVVATEWSPMIGLKAKQERDLAAGKNFRMQIFNGRESSINTLTKGLAKNRSTDPKIQHPERPELLRVPTPAEHARFKGINERIVHGISKLMAHQLLGQSVCTGPFRALATFIGESVKAWAHRAPTLRAQQVLFRVAA